MNDQEFRAKYGTQGIGESRDNVDWEKKASIEAARYCLDKLIMATKHELTVNEYKPLGIIFKKWREAVEAPAVYPELFPMVKAMTHETEVIDFLRENGFEKHLDDEQMTTVRNITERAKAYNAKITLSALKDFYPIDSFFSFETLPTTIVKGAYIHHYKIAVRPGEHNRTGIVYYNVSKIVHEALASQHIYLHLSRNEEHISTQWTHASMISKKLSEALYGVKDAFELWSSCRILD